MWLRRDWPDGVVVFDPASGNTHLIDAADAGTLHDRIAELSASIAHTPAPAVPMPGP